MSKHRRFVMLALCCLTASPGCDGATEPEDPEPLEFTFDGRVYSILKILAAPDDFFGTAGLTVRFFTEGTRSCADLAVHALPGVQVFFPAAGSNSYSAPTSVSFWVDSRSVQESRNPPFEGAISAVNAAQTVDGWVRANGVGENGEGSIDVEFRAQLCPS